MRYVSPGSTERFILHRLISHGIHPKDSAIAKEIKNEYTVMKVVVIERVKSSEIWKNNFDFEIIFCLSLSLAAPTDSFR